MYVPINFDFLGWHIHTFFGPDLIVPFLTLFALKIMTWFGHYLVAKWAYHRLDLYMDVKVWPLISRKRLVAKVRAIVRHHKHQHKTPTPFDCAEGNCVEVPG